MTDHRIVTLTITIYPPNSPFVKNLVPQRAYSSQNCPGDNLKCTQSDISSPPLALGSNLKLYFKGQWNVLL